MSEQKLGGNYVPEQASIEELLVKHKTIKVPSFGDSVIYHDEIGTPYPALVTAGGFEYLEDERAATGYLNVIYVSIDSSKRDNYGRQIERSSSVSHVSQTTAWGRYWRWSDEKQNERP